jgi:hypothetical protein
MQPLTHPLQSKIKKAFCPPAVAEANPCLQYVRLVALPWSGEFKICRLADCGGDKARARLSLSLPQAQPSLSQVYLSYDELEADYLAGSVHPGDLKASSPRASSSLLLIPFIPGWAGGRIERHPGAGAAALQDKRRRSRASGQSQGFQGDALNEIACRLHAERASTARTDSHGNSSENQALALLNLPIM